MKRMLASLFLAILASSLFACKYVVPKFRANATDGKTYSNTGFVGKANLIVFLNKEAFKNPQAISRFNRLASDLKGNVQVVGIFAGSLQDAKRYARQSKVNFPLIADADKSITKGFGVKQSLQMTITAPKSGEARFPKIWEGYSEPMIEEALDSIKHHGFKVR